MGLALGSSIISNNHEYGYKENVNAELALAKAYTNSCKAFSNSCSNAETNALQSMNNAKSSEDNAKISELNALESMNSAKESAASVKVWKTNCITELPQDIKLELNNRRLTLKAGSKVYVPNGFEADGTTLKFDKVVIESDIRVDSPAIDGPNFIYYVSNGKFVIGLDDKHQCSGPSFTIDSGLWYNTTNNFIRFAAEGEVSEDNESLPLAIINVSNGDWTSIDQVFNGFGYIGSTVFALPGVKGLIPNGRNEDGSLKNIEFTVDRVLTRTIEDEGTRDNVVIGFSPYHGISFGFSLSAYYDGNTNFNKEGGRNWFFALIGNASYSATKFTSFTPQNRFSRCRL